MGRDYDPPLWLYCGLTGWSPIDETTRNNGLAIEPDAIVDNCGVWGDSKVREICKRYRIKSSFLRDPQPGHLYELKRINGGLKYQRVKKIAYVSKELTRW
jgi:hypothetical protein